MTQKMTKWDKEAERKRKNKVAEWRKMTKWKDRERRERETESKMERLCEGYHNHGTEWCVYMEPHHYALTTDMAVLSVNLCNCVDVYSLLLTAYMPTNRDLVHFKMKPVIFWCKLSFN